MIRILGRRARDGQGDSLEFLGEGDPNEPNQWQTSRDGGTPGAEGEIQSKKERLIWRQVILQPTITLSWESSAEARYQVEWSNHLGDWESVGEIITASSTVTETNPVLTNEQRQAASYLRVRLLDE